jgi:AraC-like DNA-binding protein
MLEQSHGALNVEELAASLNVGYSWFRRAFRDYTGLPPAQYHLQLRLHRACELLRATRLPIAAISDELGFETAEYFSRIFKVKHGCSPRAYRAVAQGAKIPGNPPAVRGTLGS